MGDYEPGTKAGNRGGQKRKHADEGMAAAPKLYAFSAFGGVSKHSVDKAHDAAAGAPLLMLAGSLSNQSGRVITALER